MLSGKASMLLHVRALIRVFESGSRISSSKYHLCSLINASIEKKINCRCSSYMHLTILQQRK